MSEILEIERPAVSANAGGWRGHRVAVYHGQYDTHKGTGKPYGTRTLADVWGMAETPQAMPKGKALALLASSYNAHDAREHDVQQERGSFVLLRLDVDKGNPDFEAVLKALCAFAAGAAWLIYSTASSSPELRKWRGVIPLPAPVDFAHWKLLQRALHWHMEQCGIQYDEAMARAGQHMYGPNVPAEKRDQNKKPFFYQCSTVDGPALDTGNPVVCRAIEAIREIDRKAAQALAEAAQRAAERRKNRIGTSEHAGLIDAVNARYSIAECFTKYGFDTHDGENWHHDQQTSNSYSWRDYGESWVCVSAMATDQGIGAVSTNGFGYGDAFDLICHFEYSGDRNKAIQAMALEITVHDPETGEILTWQRFTQNEYFRNEAAKLLNPIDNGETPAIDAVQIWTEGSESQVPNHLTFAPTPLLQRVADAIALSAEDTDEALCLSGAIHLAACTVARRVRTNKANTAVLFLGNVARTGRGKNAAKNFVSKALQRAFNTAPASDFTSGSALFSLLSRRAAAVMHLDEFGDKLRQGLKEGNGTHIVKGFSTLKEIYSQADDVLQPAAFSMVGMTGKGREEFLKANAPIQKPHLNILAVTTPGQLADAITDASVEGGLMNRFLFVTASGQLRTNPDFDPIPPDWLIQHMVDVSNKLQPNAVLAAAMQEMSTLEPNMKSFDFCAESMKLLDAFKAEIRAIGRNDEFMADMSQRWRENAMRMALAIHAFCAPETETIAPSITAWCIDYCRHYGRRFALKTLELAEPLETYGKRRKAYLKAFREHPEGINTHSLGKLKPWRHDSPSFRKTLIDDMRASGEIALVVGAKPTRGPAPKVYVALQC